MLRFRPGFPARAARESSGPWAKDSENLTGRSECLRYKKIDWLKTVLTLQSLHELPLLESSRQFKVTLLLKKMTLQANLQRISFECVGSQPTLL